MTDYLNIGPSPCEEGCLPAGHELSRAECVIFRDQLKRLHPAGKFVVRAEPHDFGSYHEVYARLGDSDEADEAAWTAETDDGGHWDAIAKAEHAAMMKGGAQ